MGIRRPGVARNNGRVVEEMEQAPAVPSQDDLLLGPLDGGGELCLVGFFELLAGLFSRSGAIFHRGKQYGGRKG